MATLSAQVNSTSTLFSTDIYKKLIRPAATDQEMVRVGRFAHLAALFLAAVFSPIVARWGIFKFFQFTLTFVALPFMATVLMGILWKRVNYAAAVFGLVGGMTIPIAVRRLQRLCGGHPQTALLLYRRHRRSGHHDRHCRRLARDRPARLPEDRPVRLAPAAPRAYDEGVRRPWYQQLKFWWGLVVVIWLYLYWRFW